MELYFSFGSNMQSAQMTQRCPSAVVEGIGCVSGFKLAFSRRGSYRPGAVATIEPGNLEDDVAMGRVWNLSENDLRILDTIERAYVRIALPVTIESVGMRYCWTYVSFPDGRGAAPDAEYVELIIDGAREAGLPSSYVDGLLSWRQRANGSPIH